MLTYAKLWKMLEERDMKRTDLLEVISAPTLAKLGKNDNVNSSIIAKLCDFLECQPGDIMENISEKQLQETAEKFDNFQKLVIDALKEKGISEKELKDMLSEEFTTYLDDVLSGKNPIQTAMKSILREKQEAITESEEETE